MAALDISHPLFYKFLCVMISFDCLPSRAGPLQHMDEKMVWTTLRLTGSKHMSDTERQPTGAKCQECVTIGRGKVELHVWWSVGVRVTRRYWPVSYSCLMYELPYGHTNTKEAHHKLTPLALCPVESLHKHGK